MASLDSQIDELYQLPLEHFTEKRNALAKNLSGSAKTEVRQLLKPSVPVWAVNQLYWRDRPTYNALVDASGKFRAAHRALLSGQKADIRKPEQVHRAAIERALAKTIGLLEKGGLHASSAAAETIRRSLAALPTDEQPGRLTRPPEAAGFSLLTGIKPRPTAEAGPKGPALRREAGPKGPALRTGPKGPALRTNDPAKAEKAQKAAERQQQAEQRKQARPETARRRAEAAAERTLKAARAAAERAANRLKEAQHRLSELEKKGAGP